MISTIEGLQFYTYENVSGAYTEEVGDRFGNAILKAVRLRAASDHHDTPVSEQTVYTFRGRLERTEGHIFLLTFPAERKSVVYIVPAPDIVVPAISVDQGMLRMECDGCSVVRGECKIGEEAALCRAWYRSVYHPKTLVAMSNTWGDRGGAAVVYEQFLLDEIDAAQRLGVDVMQVDAGWSKQSAGGTDAEGFRTFGDGHWDVVEEKFPHGIEVITPYATARGVETGLWFCPHCSENYKYFDRDIAILKNAYDAWGFHCFKLDALQLNTMEKCRRTLDFIKAILAFGEDATVELDVTANQRLGYLMGAPYGKLFVENRYTAFGSYYPHATLRNLWKLSEYIPTSKLQMELVNPCRYTEKYRADDVFRPETYGTDYLFASVMVSNPLFWMEMQHMPEREAERLSSIVSVWKRYRNELACADVRPICEEPSGASLTGFVATTDDALHLILLREVTDRDTFTVEIGENFSVPALIASNAETEIMLAKETLTVRLSSPRAYTWIRISRRHE